MMPPRDRMTRVRWAAFGSLPLIAATVAFLATRPRRESVAGGPAPIQAGSDRSRLVMLSSLEARRIGVTYAPAMMTALTREVRTSGQVILDERRSIVVSARVDGWVEHLSADFAGQRVIEGAPLLVIYSPMLVAAEEELLLAAGLQSSLGSADSSARQRAADLAASARAKLASWAMSPDEIAAIERQGRSRRLFTIHSPASGFVMVKSVTQGQRIMAGDPLYRITDLSRVWIEGSVYERDLSSVHVGQAATAELDAASGTTVSGRVSYIYPTLDPETRTARLRIEVDNPAYRIKPGMFATIRLTTEGLRVLTVPRTAVLATGERVLVFVKRGDGMLEPREVSIGASNEDRTEVTSGLSPGDSVVASATFLVDAESNLGTAMGGMGNMPGMDIASPAKKGPPR
jgi:membrane fusion protein, copper/silver efflux system